MILLYPDVERTFDTNGLGALSDCISCQVTEEQNGAYELEMQYPLTGIHYTDIKNRNIIFCKPDPYRDPQPFRIYRITKPFSGRITVYAQHISYDLSGMPVSPFTASSCQAALQGLTENAATENLFTFWTDKTTSGNFTVKVPSSTRSLLGGTEGSILDTYKGEYEFDRWIVKLWEQRGKDSGVTIRYGKNLTNLEQDENVSNVITGIYPYWAGNEGEVVELSEKVMDAKGKYNFEKVIPLDLSGEFETQPTEDQLRDAAVKYIEGHNIGLPTVSISISFQPLEQTEEYKNLALLERVNLCDTVTVEYPNLGVSATAKCIKTVYDALKDRYSSIELGDSKTDITDTIANQQEQIEKIPESTAFKQAVENATGIIVGNKGGYVVLRDTNGDKKPDEILIMDTPDILTAKKVWRWNNSGLGYSANGYNGPYATAITQDGAIVANMITSGILNGNIIKAGIIRGYADNGPYFDLSANGGKGEIASSILRGIEDGSTTSAKIGQGSYSDGTLYEGLRINTSSGAGSSFIIAISKEAGSNQRANKTDLMAFGDLTIRSSAASEDDDVGCQIYMKSESGQGKVLLSRGLPSGKVTNIFSSDESATVMLKNNNCVQITDNDVYIYHKRKINFATGDYIQASIENNGAYFGDIYSNGILVTSDRTKKADITPLDNSALDKIERAQVYRYKLKGQDDKKRVGIMYDEAPNEIRREDEKGHKTVDLYGMVSILWKAVQELNNKIGGIKD